MIVSWQTEITGYRMIGNRKKNMTDRKIKENKRKYDIKSMKMLVYLCVCISTKPKL